MTRPVTLPAPNPVTCSDAFSMHLCVKGKFSCVSGRVWIKPPGVVGQRVLGLVVGSGK